MGYERRRNALIRLGAPPCERCGRPAPDRKFYAAPKRFLPMGHNYTPERKDPILVAMCCPRCRRQVEEEKALERRQLKRKQQYEQQQHEIRMHQLCMEGARTNPEYVRGCIQMQQEMKDVLGQY